MLTAAVELSPLAVPEVSAPPMRDSRPAINEVLIAALVSGTGTCAECRATRMNSTTISVDKLLVTPRPDRTRFLGLLSRRRTAR